MTETRYDGRRVRLLTMIDEGNRAGLEIVMGVSVPSRRHPSTRRARCRAWLPLGDPRRRRAGIHGADVCRLVHRAPRAIHYIQPGRPDQDAYIERVNRSYRAEVLNADLFESLAELRALTDTWLRIYNSARPHDSLGRVPPLTFLPRPSSAGQSLPALST
jgi:putative transposase